MNVLIDFTKYFSMKNISSNQLIGYFHVIFAKTLSLVQITEKWKFVKMNMSWSRKFSSILLWKQLKHLDFL